MSDIWEVAPGLDAYSRPMAAEEAVSATIEISERGQRRALAWPIERLPCTIGRSPAADCVLTDPSVAAEHLRLTLTARGEVQVDVLDAVNGVWIGRRHYRAGQHFYWDAGQRLTIGRCRLVFRRSDRPLPAVQRWRPPSRMQWWATGLSLAALMAVAVLGEWLNASESDELARSLPPALLGLGALFVLWSLGWAAAGRLLVGTASFGVHLRIAALGSLGLVAVFGASAASAYAFSLPALVRHRWFALAAVVAIAIWFHLRAATPVSRRKLGAALAALAVLASAAHLGLQWQTHHRWSDTLYMSTLLPPRWRVAPAVSPLRFIAGTNSLRDRLRSRLEAEQAWIDGADWGVNGLD